MPSDETPTASAGAGDFVKHSTLYQEFLAEREEILRHKWIESERLGYDVGFERALLDWIRKHRDSWRAARRAPGGLSASGSGRTQSPFASAAEGALAPTRGAEAK
jgi:hypothetical protein